ncbi:type II secretion system F family protein [soil metagenome]
MAKYTYTARDSSGAAATGTIEAASLSEVSAQLRAEGKYATSITPVADEKAKAAGSTSSYVPGQRGIKIPRNELIQFSMQLSIMVETGVTLSDALECIAQQTVKPQTKALVQDLLATVRSGTDFSTALQRHPRSFPTLYIALIKASERSGMMSKLIMRATEYLRDEQEIVRKVKGALTYPAIMLSFAVLATTGLLAFVLPKFTAIYAAKAAALPVPTKVLMAISDFLVAHYISLPLGVGVTALAVYMYVSTPGGKRTADFLQLRLPLLGAMFRKLHLARGLRMIGTMSASGVTLIDCVNTARDLCNNSYFQEMWDSVLEQIKAGRQMSEPMFASPLVPRSIAQMLHSAERSGKLAYVMEQVAGYSETELKENITEMTRYIEPAMIVLMGIVIGGIAMAMLLPIFTISRVLH